MLGRSRLAGGDGRAMASTMAIAAIGTPVVNPGSVLSPSRSGDKLPSCSALAHCDTTSHCYIDYLEAVLHRWKYDMLPAIRWKDDMLHKLSGGSMACYTRY